MSPVPLGEELHQVAFRPVLQPPPRRVRRDLVALVCGEREAADPGDVSHCVVGRALVLQIDRGLHLTLPDGETPLPQSDQRTQATLEARNVTRSRGLRPQVSSIKVH